MIWGIGICLVLLLLVAAIQPRRSGLSSYEIERRVDNKESKAIEQWRQDDLYATILAMRRVLEALLIVIISTLLVNEYGWMWGFILATTSLLLYQRASSLLLPKTLVSKLYIKYESKILKIADGLRKPLKPIIEEPDEQALELSSREELEHVIETNQSLLSQNERQVMKNALGFEDKLVRDYMTPRGIIESISTDELLGPLVLDDLHKTGHSHFPVRDGDIDHIVGVLHIQDLFALKDKQSSKVSDVMEPKVYYIRDDQSLARALTAFIKTRRHLFIVINKYRETVGILALEDVMEVMLGRKIIDQFDRYDDLRAVAETNPRGNNTSSKSSDI